MGGYCNVGESRPRASATHKLIASPLLSLCLSAASIDNDTLKDIDTQAASSAAVETEHALSPEGSSHAAERERLEKLLKNRSDAKELEEKNILKGACSVKRVFEKCVVVKTHGCFALTAGNVAPALQAKRIELEKQQLEDKLEGRLERRPDREDLERRGIVRQREEKL